MDCKKRIYKIPFESLLLGVTQKLELPPPMYGCAAVQQNIAFVVIRIIVGCKGYYFQGKRRKCLLQSERDAAERATIYLARKFKIMVEDINSEKRDRFTRCASFYKAMTATLEGHGPAGVQLTQRPPCPTPVDGHFKSVTINYTELLCEIVRDLGVSATDIEHTTVACGGYVCWFALGCHKGERRLEWVFSDACSDLHEAECNLAKKATLYLQFVYKFEVRDITYHQIFLQKPFAWS